MSARLSPSTLLYFLVCLLLCLPVCLGGLAVAAPAPAVVPVIRSSPLPHNLVDIRADKIFHSADKTVAEGNVVALSEGVEIEADHLTLDHVHNVAIATGHVRVLQAGDEITATYARYDLKSSVAYLRDVFGIARNLNFQSEPLQGELFFWSRDATWNGNIIELHKGIVTTCDFPPPHWHYHLSGDRVTIFPKDKIVIRKARLYVGKGEILGRKVIVLSLKDRKSRQDLVPRVGISGTDGFYAKETLHYLAGKTDYGIIHLDYIQKAGLGTGLEHYFHLGNRGDGSFWYYNVPPSRGGTLGRYEVRTNVNYHFDPTTTATLNYNSSQYRSPVQKVNTPTNEYFATSLTRSGTRYVAAVSSGFFSAGDIHDSTYGFVYNVNFSDRLYNHLEAQYTRSASSLSSSLYLHSLDRLTYNGDLFDSDLIYEQTTGTTLFRVNRRPEVELRSNALRVGDLPLRLSLGLGQIDEEPSGARSGRADLQLAIPDVAYNLGSSGVVRAGAGFRQLFYSTGDAQYLTVARASVIENLGANVRTFLDYRYQRAHGFTPLQSDFFGRYHSLSGGMEVTDNDWIKFGVDLGRDLDFSRYYNLEARLELSPFHAVNLNTGVSFDPNGGRLQNVDSLVRIPLSPTLSFQDYTLFDAINHRLTYHDFMLQDNSHDWVTSLIYRSVQREFMLQVELKAFPFNLPVVGANNLNPVLPLRENRGLLH